MNKGMSFTIVQPGTDIERSVLGIQEQYKKYFFVRYSQLEAAVKSGQVTAACQGEQVLGYFWAVRRNGVVKVRYLAVDQKLTQKGVGRALVEHLKAINQDAYAIQLSCRTDYPGWKFWKKIGFTVVRDRPGKAKSGSTLTDFCLNLTSLPLFKDEVVGSQIPKVAVDANVFFDIEDEDRPHHDESMGLMADWLSNEFDFCVTVAIRDDIGRATSNRDSVCRVQDWNEIEGDPAAVKSILCQLTAIIGVGETPQDQSDRMHLAHAIAENVTAFITRDEFLLESSDRIYEQFGISLCRPSKFVVDADMLLNQWRYDRHDLTSIGIALTRLSNPDSISELGNFRRGTEKERVLRNKLRTYVSHPDLHEVTLVTSNGDSIALLAMHFDQGMMDISMFRCSAAIEGRRRSRTLMRYLLSTIRSRKKEPCVIKVSDSIGVENFREDLVDAGFIYDASAAYKICLPGVWTPEDAMQQVAELASAGSLPSDILSWFEQQVKALGDAESFLRLEHAIYPGKIFSNGIVASIVVPIRPQWARALFDPHLGQKAFWDEDADLLLNPTSVYYTGARPKLPCGRIVWYVSQSDGFGGSKMTRACSQLTKRVIDTPINLYRQFRHYGIYELADVESLSTSSRQTVLALQFTDTELFTKPLSLAETRSTIQDDSQDFQWPTPISEQSFLELYKRGFD